MTVGGLSQGRLNGGELYAEWEGQGSCIWREREEGRIFQGQRLAGRSLLGIGVEPFV